MYNTHSSPLGRRTWENSASYIEIITTSSSYSFKFTLGSLKIVLWSSDKTGRRTTQTTGKRYCISRKKKSFKGSTSRARLAVRLSNVS